MKYREGLISAYHNYLIDQMLTPGFVLGEPEGGEDFWLLADVLFPEEKAPFLAGRFFDQAGRLLAEMQGEEIIRNPGNCVLRPCGEGFDLLHPSGDLLLAARTEVFANGYLTRIQGKLHDRKGLLRLESAFDSTRVVPEKSWRALGSPMRTGNAFFPLDRN